MISEYEKIVLQGIPLIDVRAPIEYDKGSFLNSVNYPIMSDNERHLVGICYKEKGNEEAMKLGHQLVSGSNRQEKINNWVQYLKQYPNSMLYCFRGGSRSQISQAWIKESMGMDIPYIEGGYKAFRNYLMAALDSRFQQSTPILLGGCTGVGKTTLLKRFDNFIDLEGIANHRGSSFGTYITKQPTQVNFENNLAYELIKHKHKGYQYMLLEDEGSNIGRCFIPTSLSQYFNHGDLVVLEVPFENRVQNTVDEYVIESQIDYRKHNGDEGLIEWSNYIITSINKIKKRLGDERYKLVLASFERAFKNQISTGNHDMHHNWIEILLKEYYDPMYQYQIQTTTKNILFKGDTESVYNYLLNHYNN